MPKIDTLSVRNQLESLRAEFSQLSAEGKVSQDVGLLFKSLLGLVELLVAIFMEKTTKKTSKNSSKPSSQTEKDESSKSIKGSNSRGKVQTDNCFSSSQTQETVELSTVSSCDVCGEDLTRVSCEQHERRTKIDIVFTKVVQHVDAEIKTCPECANVVKGEFPDDMPGPLQYGNGLKAFLINLVVTQMIALGRVQKMIATIIGVAISESSILKYILQLYNSLEEWENSAKNVILKSKVMHCDETSLRVNKKNHWVHSYSSGDITLKFLHPKRGCAAIDDIGIVPRYGGVIIHDCWSAYFSYANCLHALCGSHLLRDLVFVIDSNGYAWAKSMKRLLQNTCRIISKRKSKKLNATEYAKLQKRYRTIITKGEKSMPPLPTRENGKRGKIAKSDAHNLLERLKKHETGVLMFARIAYVSFTNNRAERDLRMDKVKQKVSGCFRSETLAKAYCRISSYLSTMANRGVNPLIAIQMALAGKAPIEKGGE